MLFNKNKQVELSFTADKLMAESDRQSEALKALDFYNGNQTPYVYDRLCKYFSDPDRFSLTSLNIVKKIIDAKSQVYLRDATRTVSTVKDNKLYKNIQESSYLGLRLRQANRLSKLLGVVLLKLLYRNGIIGIDILSPNILSVETGFSPQDLKAVIMTYYPSDGKATEVIYKRWTPESIQTLDYRGDLISSEDNPYNFLPFVPIHRELPISDFWLEQGDSLVSMQEIINEKLVDLAYILRMQGFSIPVVKGSSAITTFDPGQAISLPSDNDSDFKFESPKSPIPSYVNAIDWLIREIAVTEGLPASYLSSKPSERKSGYALLVQNKELQEIRENDIDLFKVYEKQIFQVIKKVWNYHNPNNKFGDSTLKVNFFDPAVTLADEDRAVFWGKMIELNAMSAIDIIVKMDPDLSREDAIKIYEQNKLVNSNE